MGGGNGEDDASESGTTEAESGASCDIRRREETHVPVSKKFLAGVLPSNIGGQEYMTATAEAAAAQLIRYGMMTPEAFDVSVRVPLDMNRRVKSTLKSFASLAFVGDYSRENAAGKLGAAPGVGEDGSAWEGQVRVLAKAVHDNLKQRLVVTPLPSLHSHAHRTAVLHLRSATQARTCPLSGLCLVSSPLANAK